MKIIPPSHEILFMPDPIAILKNIEIAGRTCYKSEDKITQDSAAGFVKRIIKSGHHSVIEHMSVTVRFICDRAIANELVRHRLASYCISGDTVVVAFRNKNNSGSTQKSWTLKQLWDWQGDVKRKGRLKLIRLRSVDENGVIVPGKIKQIINSGEKEVYRVLFKSGREIKSTMQHKYLSPSGWKRLQDLKVGDKVVANGVPALENKNWLERVYIEENNTLKETAKLAGCCVSLVTRALRKHGINKPLSMRKNRKPGHGVKGMHSLEEKQRISRRMSGKNNHRWKGDDIGVSGGRLRARKWYKAAKCWGCGEVEKLERHHMDGNPTNNKKDNIMILCQKCHKAFHSGPGVLTVFSDEIIKIEKHGIQETFDIEMKEEPHNFVANGIVVHNSQESTRYVMYSKDKFGAEITVIKPCFWDEDVPQYHKWKTAMEQAEENYMSLIEMGARAEEARSILPNSLKTEIVMTANLREWRHVLNLRCSRPAHPQIREIMMPLLKELHEKIPAVFDDIYEKYYNKIQKKD
ncbi:thymidylate synthase (FAD) [Candidatus Magnetomoraceae bacterium gMMP-15]